MPPIASPPERPAASALPNFLVLGAQKAGTTWLASNLAAHPDVFVCPEKELYFFNREFELGLGWYARHFEAGRAFRLRGEATPGYLSHPQAPARIRECLPDVRLIATLRQPVDRAYSAFWHHLRKGRIPITTRFGDAFDEDLFEIRSRSAYAPQLERYRSYFPADALQCLIFEEMIVHPEASLRACFEFLGLEPPASAAPGTTQATGAANVGRIDASQGTVAAQRLRAWVPAPLRSALLRSERGRSLVRGGRRVIERIAPTAAPRRRFEALEDDERRRITREYFADDIVRCEQILGRSLAAWSKPQGRSRA